MELLLALLAIPAVIAHGAWTLLAVGWRRLRFPAVQGWRGVAGVVTESAVFPGRGGVEKFRITYEYDADLGRLTGSTPRACGDCFWTRAGRRAFVARYPVGAAVEVFHDPARPHRSCLDRDATDGFAAGLVDGLFVLLGGCGLAAAWYVFLA